MTEKLNTRITIGSPKFPVRFSYAYVFEARESDDEVEAGQEKKKFFSTMVLIDKKDTATITAIKSLIGEVVKEKFNGKAATLKLPLRDGDEEWEEKGDYVKGHYFFNCKSKNRPSVVGTEKDEFTDRLSPLSENEFKSGDYGRVSVNFYDYIGKKAKGVAAGLGNIQKLKDGEPLGSARSADDDFGDVGDSFTD